MTNALMRAMLAEDGDAPGHHETLPNRLEDCWDEPPPPFLNGARADHDELQGAWFSFSGQREAEFLVTGNRFAVRFSDGDIYMGTFELNLEVSPRTMDMRIDEGPARHKGKTACCIYHLDGSTLRWSVALPGRVERLTAFPEADDPQSLCLLFRREVPVC